MLAMAALLLAAALALPVPPQPPPGFAAAFPGSRVNGSQVADSPGSATLDICAKACLKQGGSCIAFNWVTGTPGGKGLCELSGWGAEFVVLPNQSNSVYFAKLLPRNDSAVSATVTYQLDVPQSGVEITGGPFLTAFSTNLAYLNQFPIEDMLYWFRHRAGVDNPPGATSWGWDGHVEQAGHMIEHSHSHSHGAAAIVGHCNPGGDSTATVNGQWKNTGGAVFIIDQPGSTSAEGSRPFKAAGPGWSTTTHGQVSPNGSFWLEASPSVRSTGVFTNTSSWEKLCWWTSITWAAPEHLPPGAMPGEHWCKIGSHGCKAPPGPPPPPSGNPSGINVDGPYGLRGSVAGAFMMGSGGATRWAELPELRSRLEAVVGNISELQGEDGFAMAFPRNATNNHENPNYVQSWVTHGLLEADAGGVSGAAAVLRKHYDWFNYATDILARMLPPLSGPPPHGQPFCSLDQRHDGHCVYLIYQGMIHNTRLASSSVGTARDIQVVQELYQEDWWLSGLAARNQSMIWQRECSHNYEITAFEAYMDLYVLTGETRYLDAMEGAWDLMRNHWIHVGGSIALNEGGIYVSVHTVSFHPFSRASASTASIVGVRPTLFAELLCWMVHARSRQALTFSGRKPRVSSAAQASGFGLTSATTGSALSGRSTRRRSNAA